MWGWKIYQSGFYDFLSTSTRRWWKIDILFMEKFFNIRAQTLRSLELCKFDTKHRVCVFEWILYQSVYVFQNLFKVQKLIHSKNKHSLSNIYHVLGFSLLFLSRVNVCWNKYTNHLPKCFKRFCTLFFLVLCKGWQTETSKKVEWFCWNRDKTF